MKAWVSSPYLSMTVSTTDQKASLGLEPLSSKIELRPVNPLSRLPPELWGLVAAHLDKPSLKSLSQVTHFHQTVALRALTELENHKAVQQLKPLSLKNPPRPEKISSYVDLYQSVVYQLQGDISERLSKPKADHFKIKYAPPTIQALKLDLLATKQECYTKISKNSISFKEIEKAHTLAAITCVMQAFEDLIETSPGPQGVRGFATAQAVQYGCLKTVKFLLYYHQIPDVLRGRCVIDASHLGHYEIVKFLLTTGTISDAHRQSARTAAQNQNHLEIIPLLYPNLQPQN